MLSLLALLLKKAPKYATVMFMAGILGAALFIGDAMITPALSVLSAVEGLTLVTPAFHDYVLPISVAIMVLLFAIQSRGTGAVSIFFFPVDVLSSEVGGQIWKAITLAARNADRIESRPLLRSL
ncbi:Low affinity potassium transport system protein kup [Ensifer psoraleae]|nr:Low affinity potassium transport system protein kup [Sinorhizobium psoraleae]